MSLFGWSLPPGCNSVPGDETGSVALDVPGLPPRAGAWWTEDGLVGITTWVEPDPANEYDDGIREIRLGTLDWDDALTEVENMARAVAFAASKLKEVR